MKERLSILYVRASTLELGQVQKEHGIKYFEENGITNYKIFIDEYKSGNSVSKRPELKKVLNLIEKGQVERLIVRKLHNFSRNLQEYIYMANLMKEKNCKFITLIGGIDTTTNEGKFIARILVNTYEFENE